MISAKYIARKVQESLETEGYAIAVFVENGSIFSKNSSVVIIERDSRQEYVMPLKQYNSCQDAISAIIQTFFDEKFEAFRDSIDKKYVTENVYPVLLEEKPADCVFDMWRRCYLTYQFKDNDVIVRITSKHLRAMGIGPRDLTEYANNNLIQSLEIHNFNALKNSKVSWAEGLNMTYFDVKCDDICFLHSDFGNVTGVISLPKVFSVIADSKKSDLLVIAISEEIILVSKISVLEEIYSNSEITDIRQLGYSYLRSISKYAYTKSVLSAPYKFSRSTSRLELL